MREGHYQEEIMAFGSDRTTHAKLDRYFLQIHPGENWLNSDSCDKAGHNLH